MDESESEMPVESESESCESECASNGGVPEVRDAIGHAVER